MYKCELCDRNFGTSNGLTIHERSNPHKKRIKELSTEMQEPILTIGVEPKTNRLVKLIRDKMTLLPPTWDTNKINEVLHFIAATILADHQKEEYPISARQISNQIGYSQFQKCKDAIIKFTQVNEYKIVLTPGSESKSNNKKEDIMLSIAGFKRLCANSGGPMASQICLMYMDAFTIFQVCIMDPTNDLINAVREEVKTRIQPTPIELAPDYTREAQITYKLMDKDAIYLYRLYAEDAPNGKVIYKYGITFRMEDRPDEHRDRFKCPMVIIDAVPVDNLNRRSVHKLETSIGSFIERLGLAHKYMKSKETFVLDSSDTSMLKIITGFIHSILPLEDESQSNTQFETRKLELDHEYRMRKLDIEMRRLDLSIPQVDDNDKSNANVALGDISTESKIGTDKMDIEHLKWVSENQPQKNEGKTKYFQKVKNATSFSGSRQYHNKIMEALGWKECRSTISKERCWESCL